MATKKQPVKISPMSQAIAKVILEDQDEMQMWARKMTHFLGFFHNFAHHMEQEGMKVTDETFFSSSIGTLSSHLYNHYRQFTPKLEGVYGSILKMAVDDANWYEVALLVGREAIKLSEPADPEMQEVYKEGYRSYNHTKFEETAHHILDMLEAFCHPTPEEPLEHFDE